MFDLFKKKEATTKIIDKVWLEEAIKFQSLVEEWKKDNTIIYIFWFDETLRNAASFFAKEITKPAQLLTARKASSAFLKDKNIIFAEHYPLQQKEKELYKKLNLEKVNVWSALDEPLFQIFGSEKIIQLMKQLGMKENESVQHTMLSKAIQNAQEKIEKKFRLNTPPTHKKTGSK